MNIEELKEINGSENIPKEEGEKIIDTLVQLTQIAYEFDLNVIIEE